MRCSDIPENLGFPVRNLVFCARFSCRAEGQSQEHTAPLLCLEEHASMRALAANTRNSGKLRLGVTVLLSAVLPSGWRSDWALASRYASGRSAGAFYHVKYDPDADLEEAGQPQRKETPPRGRPPPPSPK